MNASTRTLIPLATLVLAAALACGGAASSADSREGGMSASPAVEPQVDAMADAASIGAASDQVAAAREMKVAARAIAPAPSAPAAPRLPTQAAPRDSADVSTIIRSGSASLEVDSLEVAIAAVERVARSLGGWVGNSSLSAGSERVRSATLELKIPAPRYDDALRGLDPVGRVESVSSTAEDVGEEFVDLSARIANARRLEERLVTLLATRTGKLEDALAVERELARVREEIERQEGRLRYLRARTATSTLVVTVHEPFPIVGTHPGDNPIGEAFREMWRNFVGFTAAAIASLGILAPVALITAVAWALIRRWRKGVAKATAA